MDAQFYSRIVSSTAHRPVRDELSGLVLQHPHLLPELIAVAFNLSDKSHHKACWILELVVEAKPDWLLDYLDPLCDRLTHYRHEGALRSISKICLFALAHHQKHSAFLAPGHCEKITEACFDWLIGETKVATKAYAARALYLLGLRDEWIWPELRRILAEDFARHSAAYKVVAKEVLAKTVGSA